MTKPRSLFERYRDAEPNASSATPELQKGGMLEEQVHSTTGLDGRPRENSDLASKLEQVTEKAIDKMDETLDLPLPNSDHASFGAVLRAQNAAANTLLNAQIKVDENRLRSTAVNKLPELLEILREEQIKFEIRQVEREAGNG